MNLKRLESRVMKDEGFRDTAYQDTEGIWTIGYGTTRLIGGPVYPGDKITPNDAKRLLRADLYGAVLDAQGLFTRFEEMSGVRQEVLANMAYNLGRTRLARFTGLIAAADELAYAAMADEMMYRNPPQPELSPWYVQTKGRAHRLVAAMRTGDWLT